MERIVLAMLLFACVLPARAKIVIDKPWARSTVPGQSVAGASMKTQNVDVRAEVIDVMGSGVHHGKH
jgi:copper(I)-binding protein